MRLGKITHLLKHTVQEYIQTKEKNNRGMVIATGYSLVGMPYKARVEGIYSKVFDEQHGVVLHCEFRMFTEEEPTSDHFILWRDRYYRIVTVIPQEGLSGHPHHFESYLQMELR